MHNQILAQGDLKIALDALEVGESMTLANYFFERRDIQACIDAEIPAKEFHVSYDIQLIYGDVLRKVRRVA